MNVSRIYRVLRLITMLQAGRGVTVDDLARELEVSRRTVFRDLNMLELAHIPYYFDKLDGSYRISDRFFLPPVNLTVTEALAVMLLTGRGKSPQAVPLLAEGAQAAVKLESALPSAIRRHVGSVIDHLSFSTGPKARHEGLDPLFGQISQAIVAQKACQLVYISFSDRRQLRLEVHPLRLAFHGRAWYLLAYSPHYRQRRTFKLGRIRKLTMTDKTFTPPADVDGEDDFQGAWAMIPEGQFHSVRLRFAPMVAGNVAEVRWHPSQQVKWNEDGSIDYSVRVNGLGEIAWWILGFGDQVEVMGPPDLRRRITRTAQAVVRKYVAQAPSAGQGDLKEGTQS